MYKNTIHVVKHLQTYSNIYPKYAGGWNLDKKDDIRIWPHSMRESNEIMSNLLQNRCSFPPYIIRFIIMSLYISIAIHWKMIKIVNKEIT